MDSNIIQSCKMSKLIAVAVISFFLYLPANSFAKQEPVNKILIIYYSNTGNTKAACDALQRKLSADMIEIKDLKNNPGKLTMKMDKKLNLTMDTEIEPKKVDISAYPSIILGSPIWMGTLSPALRKFIALNNLAGKKVVIFTTTNAYENEKLREKSKNFAKKAAGKVVGYYQVLAMEGEKGKKVERSKNQIVADTLKYALEIQSVLSSTP